MERASEDAATEKVALVAKQLEIILEVLDDAKALEVVTVDLEGKTSIADFMVVASGRSQRHVGAVASQIAQAVRANGYGRPHTEGLSNCDWVLVDTGDIIVHIFRPEVREFYNLEKLWSEHTPSDQMTG